MNKTVKLISASPLLLALTGCFGPSDYDPSLTATPDQIYTEACQSCHGEKGEGKFGFLLKITDSDHSIAEIADKIEQGGIVMPGFPKMEAPQRLLVATYLKAQ